MNSFLALLVCAAFASPIKLSLTLYKFPSFYPSDSLPHAAGGGVNEQLGGSGCWLGLKHNNIHESTVCHLIQKRPQLSHTEFPVLLVYFVTLFEREPGMKHVNLKIEKGLKTDH